MGFFRFLFGRKEMNFTPVPDDWPPEGSMQFMRREPEAYERLPDNFLHYEFGPNWNESDPAAIDLGLKILRVLCRDKLILTDIRSTESFYYENRKKTIETFSEYYCRFLQKERPDAPVYLETNLHLVYLTIGHDEELQQLTDRYYSLYRPGTQFFDAFYVLPQECMGLDAETALARIKTFQYDMKLEYIKYGPTSLEINLNTDTVDIAAIQAVVEKICSENNVLLLNPKE